jgi:imidazolonepropionase-like amidohydrolase/Tol biopolymer transport system component
MNIQLFLMILLGFGFSLWTTIAFSQAPNGDNEIIVAEADRKWDVANPPGQRRQVNLDVDTGTWMSIDIAPDGKTIAFDLLGDIYTLPISGGVAQNISHGLPWEFQPRYSPDGSKIAFTSDRGGGENIWIMDVDGNNKRQVTEENFRLLNNPSWSPDGQFFVARKHFTTTRSLGTGEIWLYHRDGGEGIPLVKKPSDTHQKELGEPVYSNDGRYVYYSLDSTPGERFIYAQDSNKELFQIRRYDTESGETETVVSGPGGAVRPTPSPDGQYIAFVRRVRAKSALFLLDLKSGSVTQIYEKLDQDMQESWATQGLYPNMDWMPNSKDLVFWAGGKIRKLNIESGRSDVIPFQIVEAREVMDALQPKIKVEEVQFQTKMPRFAQLSPNGEQVVFESQGRLWVKNIPNGEAKPLTNRKIEAGQNGTFETQPSWSRNGKFIVYVTWDDEALGSIYKIRLSSGKQTRLTDVPGHYSNPRFSAEGDAVVYRRNKGGHLTSPKWSRNPGIYTVTSKGGQSALVTKRGQYPHFDQNGQRIYFTSFDNGKRVLGSVDLQGDKMRQHASSEYARRFEVSLNEKFIAFRENYNIYVVPFPASNTVLKVGPKMKTLPVRRASLDGGEFLHWSGDLDRLNWSVGPNFFDVSMASLYSNGSGSPAKNISSLSMYVASDAPESTIALKGAKIITMADSKGGIINDGVIIIEGNKIVSVGEVGSVTIPAEATIVELKGKTIIPGLIDAHAHGPHAAGDIIPQQNWSMFGTLALGVTTTHNPSSRARTIFTASEMQRSGLILSPRLFSTGEIIYGARSSNLVDINSYEDALSHVRRLKQQGAVSIKNYNQPRREQRQQVVAAANAENMMVVAEGGSLFHMDMSMVVDGNRTIEHNLPQSKIYEDVLQLWSQTNVGYTPTFVVTFNGPTAERYWYQETEVWKHPILSFYVPPHILQPASVRRVMAPKEDYTHITSAKTAKALADRGVSVHIGAHGQREGLASHWEMWSLAQGGMSPIEVINAATLAAAKHLGMDDEIGSIETGKLADLVIIDADVTEDIFSSDEVDKVMLNGRLYEASSLNEIVSGDRKTKPFYWQ